MPKKKIINKENNTKKRPLPKGIKIIMCFIIFISILLLALLYRVNVLPFKYFIIVILLVILIAYINIRFLRKRKKRKIGLIMSLILTIIYIVANIYLLNTLNFFSKIKSNNIVEENYLVVVKKDSDYNEIKDLKNKKIGLIDDSEIGYTKATNKLQKDIKFLEEKKEDSYELTDLLLKNEIDGLLIEDSQEKILEENYDGYKDKTKVIYTFTVEVEEESITKAKDITKDSFNIFISGIDTYGKINSSSRSDVNIVVSVNPSKGTISLVHIPRDYYVSIYKKNGLKDKLTHAGIYGIDTSVKTVEKLLDIDINYYFKFNFTSLVKIVDTLGGVKVYSEETFKSGIYDEGVKEVYTYVKGWNTLNGEEALSFARERHNIADGDLGRGRHQEALIEAILKKAVSPSIITKYNSLLNTLSNTFVTNLEEENMTNFIKMQLDKNIDWQVTKLVMNGTSSMEYTYSYPKAKLYVMLPDEQSMNKAKEQINNNNNN